MHGCNMQEAKMGECFVEIKNNVLASNETKRKGKGDSEFEGVIGRRSGVIGGRARGVTLMVSPEVQQCVLEWRLIETHVAGSET